MGGRGGLSASAYRRYREAKAKGEYTGSVARFANSISELGRIIKDRQKAGTLNTLSYYLPDNDEARRDEANIYLAMNRYISIPAKFNRWLKESYENGNPHYKESTEPVEDGRYMRQRLTIASSTVPVRYPIVANKSEQERIRKGAIKWALMSWYERNEADKDLPI